MKTEAEENCNVCNFGTMKREVKGNLQWMGFKTMFLQRPKKL